jgi:hypothetical protein
MASFGFTAERTFTGRECLIPEAVSEFEMGRYPAIPFVARNGSSERIGDASAAKRISGNVGIIDGLRGGFSRPMPKLSHSQNRFELMALDFSPRNSVVC